MKQSIFIFLLGMMFSFVTVGQVPNNPADVNQSLSMADAPPAVQAAMTKIMNQTRQLPDEVHLSNPFFETHFSSTSVTMSPNRNDLVWLWSLVSINDKMMPPSQPILHETTTKEYVDYNRGNIIERYLFHGHNIEQQFIIQEQPTTGDLRIEGTIFSEGEFTKKTNHWLWSNEHSSVKLGQLYVYDADGKEIKAEYSVECDYASITIAEHDLNAASYPVTIDPEIGPDDFRISFMGPNGNADLDAQRPAVSYNSQEDRYLVVWDGDDLSGALGDDELEIYGQYINTDGSFFLNRFRISFMGIEGNAQFDAENPDVEYNPVTNQHLVVWRGDSTANDDFQIWGQFVNNFTQLVGDNFQISETETVVGDNNSENTNGPTISYNTTDDEFLVAWPGDVGSGEFEIMGQILSGTGGEVVNDFQISEQGPAANAAFDAGSPDVIYNAQENEYLVVWDGDDNTGALVDNELEIYGQLLSNTGAQLGSDFRISEMGTDGQVQFDALHAAVSYNSIQNEYIVVWAGDQGSDSDFQVYAQRVDADGQEIGDNDVQISDMADGAGNGNNGIVLSAESPSVRYSPLENKYLVIWDGDNNGNQLEAFGQVLDASLKELNPNDFRISSIDDGGGNQREIRVNALAYNVSDGTFLSVWSGEGTGTNEEFEIFGQFLDISTIKPQGQFVISTQGPASNAAFDAFKPAIAYNSLDSNYLVVWQGGRAVDGSDQEFEIFGQLISDEGIEIGADFRISDVGGTGSVFFDAFDPDIAYNSTDNNYLVVFSADDDDLGSNEEFEIYGQFLDECGQEIGANDFRISKLGPDGNTSFDADRPSVAFNSTRNDFLVVYQGDDNIGTLVDDELEIYGQIVKPDGTLLFAVDQRYSDMGPDGDFDFNAANPDVAYNPTTDEYMIVWDGDDNTSPLVEDENEIFGQRVSGLGLEIGSDFRVSNQGFDGNALFDAFDPAIAFNSTANEYLVVWHGDFNSGNAVAGEFEIFGQLLGADGTEIGSDFRISDNGVDGDSEVDATNAEISYDGINDTYLATWQSNGTTVIVDIGGIEIYGQFISESGAEIGDNDFRISQMGPDGDDNFDGQRPASAHNPLNNNFLVVWEADDDVITQDDEFEIFGELIDGVSFDPCLQVLSDANIGSPVISGLYQASDTINSSGLIEVPSDVIFDAGEAINLLPDFEVELGASFETLLDGCN